MIKKNLLPFLLLTTAQAAFAYHQDVDLYLKNHTREVLEFEKTYAWCSNTSNDSSIRFILDKSGGHAKIQYWYDVSSGDARVIFTQKNVGNHPLQIDIRKAKATFMDGKIYDGKYEIKNVYYYDYEGVTTISGIDIYYSSKDLQEFNTFLN